MHHFVVKFSKFSSPQAGGKGALTPLTKIVRTFLIPGASCWERQYTSALGRVCVIWQ